jgi:hypothetical protein
MKLQDPIEGRPKVNVDWNAEYAKQRKDRLCDSIYEYLDDGEVSVLTLYNDLKDCVQELIDYHSKYKEKGESALRMIFGSSPSDPEFLTEDRNSNFPNENTIK